MNKDIAISVKNVTKIYKLYGSHADRVKEAFHPFRKKYHHTFNALSDVSFEVKKGETLGIIGRNGSGKSTLLQIICGILQTTSGSVEVNGRVSALLELGTGFNPEFTGRQNVYINGFILGLSHEEIEIRFDDIAAFADIGEFIDQPVKTYSSGMYVRLAFAVQACVDPDVLIVDEALSVGDIFFQQKCHARMEELVSRNTSILFVSHDMSAIEKYSTQTVLLSDGLCLFLGQPNEAVELFYQVQRSRDCKVISKPTIDDLKPDYLIAQFQSDIISGWPSEEAFLDLSRAAIIGEKDAARCVSIALCDVHSDPCISFQIGDMAYFYSEFELLKDIQVPIGGIVLTNKMNINVHGKNSLQYLLKAPSITKKGSRVRFRQMVKLSIAPGEYTFMAGFATIRAEDYARVTELDYPHLASKIKTILRVRQAGRFVVQWRSQGQSLPFHGYADLKGDCVLSVFN